MRVNPALATLTPRLVRLLSDHAWHPREEIVHELVCLGFPRQVVEAAIDAGLGRGAGRLFDGWITGGGKVKGGPWIDDYQHIRLLRPEERTDS